MANSQQKDEILRLQEKILTLTEEVDEIKELRKQVSSVSDGRPGEIETSKPQDDMFNGDEDDYGDEGLFNDDFASPSINRKDEEITKLNDHNSQLETKLENLLQEYQKSKKKAHEMLVKKDE